MSKFFSKVFTRKSDSKAKQRDVKKQEQSLQPSAFKTDSDKKQYETKSHRVNVAATKDGVTALSGNGASLVPTPDTRAANSHKCKQRDQNPTHKQEIQPGRTHMSSDERWDQI